MNNPMLPLSPMSNDGSLQRKPTLTPAGLDPRSRLIADHQDVRFRALHDAHLLKVMCCNEYALHSPCWRLKGHPATPSILFK